MKIPSWTLLVLPTTLLVVGFCSNLLVKAVNGNQMPVFLPDCEEIRFVGEELREGFILHTCLKKETRLKFLSDWIYIRGVGTMSPGDVLEFAYDFSFWPGVAAWFVLRSKERFS